jgi:hypothetical protein
VMHGACCSVQGFMLPLFTSLTFISAIWLLQYK